MSHRIKPKHWMCKNFPLRADGRPYSGDVKQVCQIGHKVSADDDCGTCPTGRIDRNRIASRKREVMAKQPEETRNTSVQPKIGLPAGSSLRELYLQTLNAANAQGIIIGKRAGIKNLADLEPLVTMGLVERKEYGGATRYRIPQVAKRRKEHLNT